MLQYMLTKRFGFKEEDITILLDDSSDPNAWPTGNNMRHHMRQLVAGCQSGDSLLFHFSGQLCHPADPCLEHRVHAAGTWLTSRCITYPCCMLAGIKYCGRQCSTDTKVDILGGTGFQTGTFWLFSAGLQAPATHLRG